MLSTTQLVVAWLAVLLAALPGAALLKLASEKTETAPRIIIGLMGVGFLIVSFMFGQIALN